MIYSFYITTESGDSYHWISDLDLSRSDMKEVLIEDVKFRLPSEEEFADISQTEIIGYKVEDGFQENFIAYEALSMLRDAISEAFEKLNEEWE